MCANHLRDTRSYTTVAATPALVKCVWGRAVTRCQSFNWSGSTARLPNRTCDSHRIRLST